MKLDIYSRDCSNSPLKKYGEKYLMGKVKIGMAQLLVEGCEPERNFERAEKLVKKAKAEGCDLVLLPETIDFAWTHPYGLENARSIPGEYSDFFCQIAKDNSIFICVGLTEKRGERNFNTAILIDDEGNLILNYAKINLLEVEFPFYEVGKSLNVVDTRLGCIGVNICADNYTESTHIGKTLAAMGADIILSPSSWTVDHWVTEKDEPYFDKWIRPLSHIAKSYDVLVISSTGVGYIVGGPYEGKKMVGCSLAVGPEGVLAKGQFNEFAGQVIVFDAETPSARKKGTQMGVFAREQGVHFESFVK